MQKRRGFTTVELVIVIAVIAILATALIPTFGGLIDSANHNADIQTARNLSTQVMMYAMENEINDEADLRAAIDTALGEGYYDNLEPKSAKKGYCYWYDYNNCQIVLGTIEEIIAESQKKLAVPSDWDITMANGLTGNKDFAAGNMRTMVIPGYFLMTNDDKNPLSEVITSLENPSLINYGDALAKLYKLADSFKDNAVVKTAVDTFVQKVAQTPILTGKGLFLTSAATSISTIYVPYGTDELASINVYVATVTNGVAETEEKTTADIKDLLVPNFKLTMPQGTRFAANVLDLERVATAGNPFMTGSDEIHINIEEKDLGTYFFADTTDAVIVLPTGRYIQNGTNFVKLTSEGQKIVEGVTAPAYGELKSFGIGFVADGAPSGTYVKDVPGEGNAYDLYISADHTGSITLTANNFKGIIDGAETTLPVRNITVVTTGTGIDAVTKGLTSTITGLKNGNTITITARDISYVYTVKVVDVNALELSGITGSVMGLSNDFALTYNKNASDEWVITPSIGYQNENASITLDIDLEVTSANGLFNFDPATNKLTLNTAVTFKGEYSDILTISCRNEKIEEVYITLYDGTLEAFKQNPNLDSMNNKGDGYVIGTLGYANGVEANGSVLTLGDLFSLKDDSITVNRATLTVEGSSNPIPLTDAANWASYDIQTVLGANVDANTKLTITLSSHGSSKGASVDVYLVKGAYNVSNAAEWAYCKGQTNPDIAVLDSFEIDGENTKSNATKDTVDKALKYAVNVGSGDVYGNYQTITVKNFYVKGIYTSNYIISAAAGSVIDRLIIVGPDFGDTVVVDNTGSESSGTYVTAVHVASGTAANPVKITNCFLSGFRTPLSVGAGHTHVNNTTLHLGNYANLYVDGQATLNLDSVTTVQYKTTNNSLGGGITYKHNCGPNQVLKATNLKQYNFLQQSEITAIVKSSGGLAGTAAQILGLSLDVTTTDLKQIAGLAHTFKVDNENVTYYHMGITSLDMPAFEDSLISYLGVKNNPAKLSDVLDVTYGSSTACSQKMTVTKQYGWISKKNGVLLNVWGLPSGAPAELPVANIGNHVRDYFVAQGFSTTDAASLVTGNGMTIQ